MCIRDSLTTVLPTAQDEIDLKELFEQEWIANKPMSTRQIESGLGATAYGRVRNDPSFPLRRRCR